MTKHLQNLPRPHQVSILALSFILLILLASSLFSADASRSVPVQVLTPGVTYSVPLIIDAPTAETPVYDLTRKEYTVRSGDNLAKIFNRFGLSPTVTHYVSRAKGPSNKLLSMMPGDHLYLTFDKDNDLQSLEYQFDRAQTLHITRSAKQSAENQYQASIEQKPITTSLQFAQGEITSSFWNAGIAAGMTDNKIMELAGIFGWDIDFAMEIRPGDTFNVIYELEFIEGELVGEGKILAAEFVNQDERFTAIRHSDGDYYNDNGRSMKKSFLRAPVNFRYVSSNFNPRRFHPVQKRIKPHRGVDYAAPIGTPIVSAGNGRVVESGYNRFNGNYVFIQHGERYQTKYLHLNKRLVKKGQTVKQGQKIGTLGKTGMVTGAHLHYEFLVDGVHRNPRTVKLPKAAPIKRSERDAFMQIAARKLAALERNKRIMLASL